MRAVVCPAWGGPDILQISELPSPAAREGHVRVAVEAAGVNFADILMVAGKYQENPPLPFVPGFEVAGRAMEAGNGFAAGERVMGMLPHGGYAQEVLLPREQAFRVPPALTATTAAGFPVVYGTAYSALVWRARLRPGERLVVFGAAGGLGLAATAIGSALGAEVIAVAAGAERLVTAARHGATHGIDRLGEDVATRIRELTGGKGADVVVDPVGGPAFDTAVRAIATGGRLVVLGFASGSVGSLSAGVALGKNMDLIGCYWGAYRSADPALVQRVYDELGRWVEAGRLTPMQTTTMPLEAAPQALTALAERTVAGKLVLETGR